LVGFEEELVDGFEGGGRRWGGENAPWEQEEDEKSHS
jgi:hypothetical protein